MKKLILTAILSLFILTSGTFADTTTVNSAKFEKKLEKAIPYGWKLGKTTCKEIESKIELDSISKDGSRSYGTFYYTYIDTYKGKPIYLWCNKEGKFDFISLYSERSLNKLGLSPAASPSEVLEYLRRYFKKNEIIRNDNTFKIYLSNNKVVKFICKKLADDYSMHLRMVNIQIDNSEF